VGRQIALEGSGNYDVPCISYDSVHGRIWLFVQKRGLYQYDGRARRLVLVNDQLRDALSLQVDVRGRVWLGTDNGLFQLNENLRGYSGSLIAPRCRVVGIHVKVKKSFVSGLTGPGFGSYVPTLPRRRRWCRAPGRRW
jgi:hypothetical protein